MPQYSFKADPPSTISPGSYICEIIKVDVKDTRDGTGHYILVSFQIIEGPLKNERFYQNFNMENKNPVAVKIGKRNFSDLCNSIDKEFFEHTDELLNKQVIVKLGPDNKLLRNGFKKIQDSIPEFSDNSNREEPLILPPDGFVDDKIPF